MTYSQQSFYSGEILTSEQVNKIEFNIRDHVHGVGDVSNHVSASFFGVSADNETLNHVTSLHLLKALSQPRYNNGFSVSNYQLSVDNTGSYLIKGSFYLYSTGTDSVVDIQAVVNSDSFPSFRERKYDGTASDGYQSYNINGFINLNPSDILAFFVTGVSSGSETQYSNSISFLDIFRV